MFLICCRFPRRLEETGQEGEASLFLHRTLSYLAMIENRTTQSLTV